MSRGDAPPTTADRTLVAGELAGTGTDGGYRLLRAAPGEPHRIRTELAPARPHPAGGRVLLRLAHVTDLHVADPQSPVRLDFAMRVGAGDPAWGGAVDAAFRPQELLAAHAAASMAETITRLPVDLCVVTGDNLDNAQANELAAYLAVLDGGQVGLCPDGRYAGTQSAAWGDDWYWQPEAADNRYTRRWGYPTIPGLLAAAARPFTSRGVGHPWLACAGNHDLLVVGTTAARAALQPLALAGRKPTRLPDQLTDPLETLVTRPQELFAGPTRPVQPHPGRRFIDTGEFVAAHHYLPARPAGHGFTEQNRRDGTAYYAYDATEQVRVIVLDTNHPYGHWDGSVDRRQLAWLADQLAAAGRPGGPLVILASHHGTGTFDNHRGEAPGERAHADELLALALRWPNVVLWLNGHRHEHRVLGHRRPTGGGLLEVTTAAIMDWPSQARLIELAVTEDGALRVTSTMVDHAAPVNPTGEPDGVGWLASLHRQLAANECWRAGRRRAGSPADRNFIAWFGVPEAPNGRRAFAGRPASVPSSPT
ncbi:MAG TPA: TIGR03767 family metallophosphoesterase [Natronosporangium sp.]